MPPTSVLFPSSASSSGGLSLCGGGAKRKRVSRACDRCHRMGNKCTPIVASSPVCQPCFDFGEQCTYDRPQKKRGIQKGLGKQGQGTGTGTGTSNISSPPDVVVEGIHRNGNDERNTVVVDPPRIETILELVELYRVLVYPIFCFFHWPSFISDVQRRRQDSDRAFKATVLAVCAIVAARLRDGACSQLVKDNPSSSSPSPSSPVVAQADRLAALVDSDHLRKSALDSIPVEAYEATLSFDYLRATALLAILAIQNGDFQQLNIQLGRYLGLSALQGFHDESQWPSGLSEMEKQERRMLYWSTYTLDVFHAMVWNGVVRHRESQSMVAYPDEEFESSSSSTGTDATFQVSWMRGWNFTTDLYRILEHTLDSLHWERTLVRPPGIPTPIVKPGLQIDTIMPMVQRMFDELPSVFKETKVMTGDAALDMYSFQAANIIVTLQTVKMAVSCSGTVSMAERCSIAGELLDALDNIPTAYMQAISAPFLHHLAGIGNLLGSVVQSPLTISAYLQTRQILLAFAKLLATLESSLKFAAGTSVRLSQHVARIDAFMQSAAEARRSDRQVFHAVHLTEAKDSAQHDGSMHRAHAGDGSYMMPAQDPTILTNTSKASGSGSGNIGEMEIWNPNDTDFMTWANNNVMSEFAHSPVTLPDDLLQYWPFDANQGTVFDSFFGSG